MASSPPLSTTDDEDEEIDVVGKDNFVRAFRKGGVTLSPKGAQVDKAGFFDRLSGKALNLQKRKNAELQDEIAELEEENIALKSKLQNEIEKSENQQRNIHAIMQDCSNIQLGDGNTIKILQYDPDIEDPIPLLKQLMKITLEANDEIVNKLTVSESKLTKNSKTLQKIHSMVLQLRESGSPLSEHQMVEQLQEIVEIPTEHDDFYSLEKAFEGLKVDEGTKCFKDLNDDAKRGIRIIVYKFGSVSRQAFANELGLKIEKQLRAGEESINESSCASIILHWLNMSGNNVQRLLGILKGFESQLIQDYMQNLKEQTFAKCYDTHERESHVQFETSTQIVYQRTHQTGESVLSLMSTRSDVSDTLDMIERHASETLQKTADCTDVKPDIEAILCAMYKLQMDNTRTLHAIDDRTVATDNKVNILVSDENTYVINEKSDASGDKEVGEDKRSEEFV